MRGREVLLEGDPVSVGKILCVGRNYAAHAGEMGEKVPSEPVLFLKPATAIVRPSGGDLFVPKEFGELHHEVELAVLLGGEGKNLSPERAARLVAGYAVALDLTLREVQARAKRAGEPWSLAKGFDGAAPMGDFVPASGVARPENLSLSLDVNGEIRQKACTSQMIFSSKDILAYASRFLTLEKGDILLTGTPEGVGPLVDGDVLLARIEGLPELRLTMRR